MIVYVVTNPELGWDCVVDVFIDKKVAEASYGGDDYVISQSSVNEKRFEEFKIKSDYRIVKWETVKDDFLVVDSCDVTSTRNGEGIEFYKQNSLDSISFVCGEFEKFCKQNDINPGTISISLFKDKSGWLATCKGIDSGNLEVENGFHDYCVANNIDIE